MDKIETVPVAQCGRWITHLEIELIRETIAMFPRLSHRELSETICENLEWYTASGSNKTEACMKLLGRLESLGIIRLPEKRKFNWRGNYTRSTVTAPRIEPPLDIIEGTVSDLGRIELEVVADNEGKVLWNEYTSRYHYLGYKRPFGFHLRYFIRYWGGVLGCVLFAGSARAIGVRDRWIGWSENQRLRNLAWVINNTRFVIFPWVRVRNLSSHVLGKISREISSHWQDRWGYCPVLMETFVDPDIYKGTSYKAAGWQCVGMTTGEGLVREGKSYTTTPKQVYVKALRGDFRRLLCLDRLVGRDEI